MNFLEPLPESCPPDSASSLSNGTAIRLLKNNSPKIQDFKSYSSLGKGCPKNMDPCKWASCSMFIAENDNAAYDQAAALVCLPKLKRFSFAAFVSISPRIGVAEVGSHSKHADYWLASDFDPAESVTKVVQLK